MSGRAAAYLRAGTPMLELGDRPFAGGRAPGGALPHPHAIVGRERPGGDAARAARPLPGRAPRDLVRGRAPSPFGRPTPSVEDPRLTHDRHRLIAAALGRSPSSVVEIDQYDFEVAIVDDEWVFRFPRRPGVEEALARDRVATDGRARGGGGGAVVRARLARSALRRLPPGSRRAARRRGRRWCPSVPRGAPCRRRHRASGRAPRVGRRVPRAMRGVRTARIPLLDEGRRAQARRLFHEAESLVDFAPALLHADLGPDHLLVRDGRLAGVIDWGDARVGDPALDYAFLLNGPFADWDVDPDLRRRARFYHRLGPWYEAHYGLFTSQPAHVDRGLAGIGDRLDYESTVKVNIIPPSWCSAMGSAPSSGCMGFTSRGGRPSGRSERGRCPSRRDSARRLRPEQGSGSGPLRGCGTGGASDGRSPSR